MTRSDHRFPRLHLAKGTVERARLMNRLIEARHQTCLLLLGPAGSGKTTLALQWRAQVLGYGFDFAWMTLMPGGDAEPMVDAIFVALNRVDPNIAREATFIYNRDSELHSADAIALPLIKGLMQYPRDIVLLIDDYQNVGDVRAHQLMQTLLDFAPPHFHLALASRSMPPLSFSRLRDKGAMMELDFQDLRFSLAEVEDFLHAQHPRLAHRDARSLYELTDGWIAGLQLVSMDLKRKPERARYTEPVQNAHDFTAYFNREVLSQLNPDTLDAMTRLAVARRFNDALATALLGAEDGQNHMNRLRRDQMFLMPIDDGERETWFRFHPLFRDLLLERFQHMPAHLQQQTHTTLSDWFGRRKLLREAVQHSVAAGNLQQAADWLDRWARELFLNGELQLLVRAVSELPRSVLMARRSLSLWLAWSQLCYRQLTACHDSIAILKSIDGESDTESRAHVNLLEFSLALQEDDTRTAVTLLPELVSMRHNGDAVLTGGRRNLLSWLNTHLGKFERARQVLDGPMQYREDGSPMLDSAFGSLMGQCLRGFTYLHEGDMRHAEPLLRDALSTSEQALGPHCEPACNAAAFLSAALYEVNDLQALRNLLEPRFNTIERVTLPDALICAVIALSGQHRLEGSYQEAFSELDRLEELAQKRGMDRMLASAIAERLKLCLQTSDRAAAEQALLTLHMLSQRHAQDRSVSSLKIQSLTMLSRARWLHAIADDAKAHEVLQALQNQEDFGPQQIEVVRLKAMQGLVEARLGLRTAAMQTITLALTLAQRLGLVRTLLDLGDEFLQLAEQATLNQELNPTVAFYLEHLKSQASVRPKIIQLTGSALPETLSERELEVVQALANAMSNKRIAHVLGISPETVKWHLKNVYGKLGVYGRDDAVARARDLGWLNVQQWG